MKTIKGKLILYFSAVILVSGNNGETITYGVDADYFSMKSLLTEEWFQENRSNSNVKWLPIIENRSGRTTSRYYIPMVRKCISVDGRKEIGWHFIAVSTSMIRDMVKDYPFHKGEILIICDANNRCVYCSNDDVSDEEIGKLISLDPVFVVLSSYDQFDLVKKAMKMGAADYLLKLSVSPETLKELFTMSKERLADRKRKGSGDSERTMWETEELRKAYFSNLLIGCSPETDIEKLGIDFDFSCMRILYVSIDNAARPEQKKESDPRILIETLRVLIEEICGHLSGSAGSWMISA